MQPVYGAASRVDEGGTDETQGTTRHREDGLSRTWLLERFASCAHGLICLESLILNAYTTSTLRRRPRKNHSHAKRGTQTDRVARRDCFGVA